VEGPVWFEEELNGLFLSNIDDYSKTCKWDEMQGKV